jgi:DNA sulfur modification protein DndB
MSEQKQKSFPALRARTGDRAYYVCLMTFSDIKDWIMPVNEIHEKKEMKSWLQRELTPKRLDQISNYLLTQPQRFFNAIVAGIFLGKPDWFPITLEEDFPFESLEIEDSSPNAFGFVKLTGTEDIFAIDGQHRVEGIKQAVSRNPELGNEQQCVMFVSHRTDDEGHKRTRRLFSTLNRYAKPVSRGDIVALSEDDAFAIVTRRLAEEYEYLKNDYAVFTRETNVPPTNKSCVTTMLALYEMVRTLAVSKSAERKKLEIGPPDESKIDQIYKDQCGFWDALRKYIPEIKEVTNVPVTEEIAGKYRRTDGGHILFRPNGQKPFARAVRILMDEGASVSDAVEALSKVPLQLNAKPWLEVLWDENKKTVITKNDVLAQNLLLYMVGFPPGTKSPSYNLEESYQKTIGDKTVLLTSIPVVKFSITK